MKKPVFYLHSAEDSHLPRWRDEWVLTYCSAGVQTPAERIMEGSLSARRPKKKCLNFCKDRRNTANRTLCCSLRNDCMTYIL